MMEKLAVLSEEQGENNIAFTTNFVLGKTEKCLEILIKSNRLPEAGFFARYVNVYM
jgi:coatomer subunit beta'